MICFDFFVPRGTLIQKRSSFTISFGSLRDDSSYGGPCLDSRLSYYHLPFVVNGISETSDVVVDMCIQL